MSNPKLLDIQRLRTGATILNIDFDPRMDESKIEKAITKHLKEDESYGDYACPSCERKITDIVPICPYCTVELLPTREYIEDDMTVLDVVDDNNLGEIVVESLAVKDVITKSDKDLEPIVTKKTKKDSILKEADKLDQKRDRQRLLNMLPIDLETMQNMTRQNLILLASIFEIDKYKGKPRIRLTKEDLVEVCYQTQKDKGFIPTEEDDDR